MPRERVTLLNHGAIWALGKDFTFFILAAT